MNYLFFLLKYRKESIIIFQTLLLAKFIAYQYKINHTKPFIPPHS